jgi:hypothetical protein
MLEVMAMSGREFLLGGEVRTTKAARGRSCWADLLVRGVVGFMVMVSCAWLAMAAPQAAGAGTAQDAKDACAPVQAAYQKTASASDSSNATNTGALNVAEAYEKITTEAGHRETCKYLRDETVSGEDANVYSDVFASKSGTANGTVWISKKNGWVLKREVDVEVFGVGKGHQAIVYEYSRK